MRKETFAPDHFEKDYSPMRLRAVLEALRMAPLRGTNPNEEALSWYSSLRTVFKTSLITFVLEPLPVS